MKLYVSGRWRRNSKGVMIWTEIKVGFNIPPDSFFEDADVLLQEKGDRNDYKLYKKDIQATETEEIGFLLFSTDRHDRIRLHKVISIRAKQEFGSTPEFSLRWRKISDPTLPRYSRKKKESDGGATAKSDDGVQTLYVEVVKGSAASISLIFTKFYSKTLANFPDEEKMHYIPITSFLQNSGITEKMVDVITRQRWFLAGISTATSNEPTNLDVECSRLRKSLRDFIMEITNSDNDPLFLSVDKSWNGAIVFTFPSKYADEAINRIADLATYLKFKKGLLVLVKHFTPDAAARAQESTWDSDLGRTRSTMDEFLEECLDTEEMSKWLGPPPTQKTVTQDLPPAQAAKPSLFSHINPNNDQSLDTFNSQPINPATIQAPPNSVITPPCQVDLAVI